MFLPQVIISTLPRMDWREFAKIWKTLTRSNVRTLSLSMCWPEWLIFLFVLFWTRNNRVLLVQLMVASLVIFHARWNLPAPSCPGYLKSISIMSHPCHTFHRHILFNLTVSARIQHFIIHVCQYCVNPVPYFVHVVQDPKLNIPYVPTADGCIREMYLLYDDAL